MALEGKTALITGGGSGIGFAISLVLAQKGADIIVNDIDLGRAEKVARQIQELGRRALVIKADVSQPQEVAAMVERATAELGNILILVNNAGFTNLVPFQEMAWEEWHQMIAVHLDGAFHCTRAVLPGMIAEKWGRIINMSSVAGLMGQRGGAHYSAAKAALLGFTKALAREVATYGITVNAIAPGPVETPLIQAYTPSYVEGLIKATPMRRLGKPEDIAYAAAFLASEEASFITGQVISPNGGHYM